MIPVNEGKAVHIAVCVRIIILFPTSSYHIFCDKSLCKNTIVCAGQKKSPSAAQNVILMYFH